MSHAGRFGAHQLRERVTDLLLQYRCNGTGQRTAICATPRVLATSFFISDGESL
jgi:hypothetical protein